MSRSPARAVLLAALGGVLHFLGFVGFGIWPLALVCLVPLWRGLDAARGRLWCAAGLGAVFGWVSYAGGYLWIWRVVDVFLAGNVWLGGALWLADASWFALRYALYALAFVWLRRRGHGAALAGVPTLLVVEWGYPLLFPVYLGHALGEWVLLLQISDLGGPLLLSALVALCNAAVFECWRRGRDGAWQPGVVAAALLVVAAAALYGARRMAVVDDAVARAPGLRVGIVQGNLGVQEKGMRAARDHARYLEQTRALLAAGPVDLVVWPETVYTRGLRGPLPLDAGLVRQDLPAALLFGGVFVDPATAPPRVYNAALLVEPDGVIRSAYRKHLLIPFTEFVPFASWLPGLASRFDSPSHFAAAAAGEQAAVAFAGRGIATPICYEAVRPDFVRQQVRAHDAQLIVTLANDAWFGDSQEPALHLAMARLRAVEHRRFLVRATNSGISAVVDPTGRIVAQSGLLTQENLRADVAWLALPALYTRAGDWPGWLALVVVAGLAVRRR
ncbi:MAG: apolipoprotein N-acyltransferase [Deltaproteobacteria bacterium]|nr:apolipoprotein N-acyltransferase [Deltaproteobacteria bacterium]